MMAMMVCCSKTVDVELTLRSEINKWASFLSTCCWCFCVRAAVVRLSWNDTFSKKARQIKERDGRGAEVVSSLSPFSPCMVLGPAEANVCKEKEKNVDWLVSCIQENCVLKLKVKLCFTFPPQASSGSTSKLTAGTYQRSIATRPVSLSHVWDLMSDSL